VMRNAVGLTPLTVVLAVLVGSVLGGAIGAVLAIPVAAAVQVLLQNILYGGQDDPLTRDAGTSLAASLAGPTGFGGLNRAPSPRTGDHGGDATAGAGAVPAQRDATTPADRGPAPAPDSSPAD